MIKVVHGGVGAINESDVILASASNAIIIGFMYVQMRWQRLQQREKKLT